ncbi:hypothetical protein GJ744_004600 [Endocarpon pusillum]|uniref:Uncharacterized protein n=1 Tax=Endocarpon pusillum TaxID=364733 RepID=A0A8H7AQM9_9EURO|nr:hypothetical protein GJ744_004600 [Endocarpon pusillum]
MLEGLKEVDEGRLIQEYESAKLSSFVATRKESSAVAWSLVGSATLGWLARAYGSLACLILAKLGAAEDGSVCGSKEEVRRWQPNQHLPRSPSPEEDAVAAEVVFSVLALDYFNFWKYSPRCAFLYAVLPSIWNGTIRMRSTEGIQEVASDIHQARSLECLHKHRSIKHTKVLQGRKSHYRYTMHAFHKEQRFLLGVWRAELQALRS